MADLTNVIGKNFRPDKQSHIDPPDVQARDAIMRAGLEPPEVILFDGQIHRFSTNGKKGDDAGWYVFYDEGVPAGRFGCWRDMVEVSFKADIGRELTPAENMAITRRISDAKKLREQEQKRKHQRAADTVEQIWSNAGTATQDHPYLQRKQIDPHGVRITGDGRLMVPMFNAIGDLISLQYINTDGDKKYHSGGEVKGARWHIRGSDEVVYIAEGFATAASIYEATGSTVYMAFSAGNLASVARSIRESLGDTQPITVVADNDISGTGQKSGREAADAIGAKLIIPPEIGDANDYVVSGHSLHDLLEPKTDDWLIQADDFSKQPAPIKWMIKHWVQEQALMMVHGPSGGGKTFMVLDWCLTMAADIGSWCGNRVKPGAVVYLAGEGHHGLRGRVAAWKHHHSAERLNMWLSKAGCDLNTPDGYTRVIDSVSALPEKPSIIVVDTLHRFLDGDENSAQDTKSMLDACNALMAFFNCTVILVHHTGVSDEAQHRARGSSAWKGALDIEVSVIPEKDDAPMQIIQRKAKDAETAEPVYGELMSVEIPGWIDEDGEAVSSAVFNQTDAPPEKPKIDNALNAARKLFERAWWASGCEDIKGRPYVTRSKFAELLESDGMAQSTIKNYMKTSYPKGAISQLINGEIIQPELNGWVMIDSHQISGMMLAKGEK